MQGAWFATVAIWGHSCILWQAVVTYIQIFKVYELTHTENVNPLLDMDKLTNCYLLCKFLSSFPPSEDIGNVATDDYNHFIYCEYEQKSDLERH